jgi:uncharacterized protein YbjT (DUF2867 family)
MKTATVIGATGLIGGQLTDYLLKDDYYEIVRVLVRRPVTFNHPKIREIIVDFSDEKVFRAGISGSDALFCAIGTTNKKANGDKIAYRKVDFDIPVKAAQFCEESGVLNFLVVSSVGADSKSNNFYLKLKGEVEDVLDGMKIQSISIFRPSILLGKRSEFRFGELIAKLLSVVFSFMVPSKYKPIQAKTVALSMIVASKQSKHGCHIFHYSDMMKL